MPTVSRARTVAATPEEVWDVVSDPHHLPRWWPGLQRVEEVTGEGWTKVLRTPRGKTVRADFSWVTNEPPRRLAWRQEVEESPFERFLAESITELRLDAEGEGSTRVSMSLAQKLRGTSKLGGILVRRAARKQVADALEGLERAVG